MRYNTSSAWIKDRSLRWIIRSRQTDRNPIPGVRVFRNWTRLHLLMHSIPLIGMADRKRKLDIGQENEAAASGSRANPTINPYTGKLYTPRYYDILSTRVGERAHASL